MSLNIDINEILPVKVSGVGPKSLSRLPILSQSCNVVNPGKMFHSNSVDSIDSIIISVASFYSSKHRWNQDVEEPFRGTTKNPRRQTFVRWRLMITGS